MALELWNNSKSDGRHVRTSRFSDHNSLSDHTADDRIRRWFSKETTFVHTTLAPLESNVTLLTPRTSPRILHLSVVCASLTSVTDGQNTMVETRAA